MKGIEAWVRKASGDELSLLADALQLQVTASRGKVEIQGKLIDTEEENHGKAPNVKPIVRGSGNMIKELERAEASPETASAPWRIGGIEESTI